LSSEWVGRVCICAGRRHGRRWSTGFFGSRCLSRRPRPSPDAARQLSPAWALGAFDIDTDGAFRITLLVLCWPFSQVLAEARSPCACRRSRGQGRCRHRALRLQREGEPRLGESGGERTSRLLWGSRGRRFKSCQPDQEIPGERHIRSPGLCRLAGPYPPGTQRLGASPHQGSGSPQRRGCPLFPARNQLCD
jgi:hypothetical protein